VEFSEEKPEELYQEMSTIPTQLQQTSCYQLLVRSQPWQLRYGPTSSQLSPEVVEEEKMQQKPLKAREQAKRLTPHHVQKVLSKIRKIKQTCDSHILETSCYQWHVQNPSLSE